MQSQDLSAVGYLVRDLEDIAVGITHHGTPVAVWRVQRSFQRFSALCVPRISSMALSSGVALPAVRP
jgi:hypothetical protein